MKKKLLALVLVVVLAVTAVVGGTMAYLTDTDEAVNVMTLGNVHIKQLEYERVEENGAWVSTGEEDEYGYTADEMQEFTQAKPLYPAVYQEGTHKWDDRNGSTAASGEGSHQQSWWQVGAPGSNQLFDDSVKNVIDKFVFVENTGKSDAYVRTVFAFEAGSMTADDMNDKLLHYNVNDGAWTWVGGSNIFSEDMVATIDGVKYYLAVATYTRNDGVVTPGEVTRPSLLQVFLDPKATNELCASFGDTYEILVLSQAVQTAGFSDAKTALDAAFGEVNPENVAEWFGGTYIPDYSIPAATVEEGTVTLTGGESAVLSGTQEAVTVSGVGTLYLRDLTIKATEGSALTIAEGSSVKIVVENDVELVGAAGGSGIDVPAGAALDLSGAGGSLTAVGNNGVNDSNGGNGIGGQGTINIHDLKELTAEGWGVHGFGIGGATSSVTITNTSITYVKGGYVQQNLVNDTSYGKSEPEGGAAIGSSVDGAVITLTNVTLEYAEGGSKSAGIGAQYWTGVTVNINDSNIKKVVGGNASAGIGGSRIAEDASAADAVTVNISNSTITAYGGEFGAGIGSGYDTHCSSNQPVHTIYITGNSVITAYGGKYGAGIGTGYHVASLAGGIDSTVTVNATAGAAREKYTVPMAVGFGVIDKEREGKDNTSSFNYQGTTITVDDAPAVQ